jgi:short-subunit dehydrogenase
VKKTITASTSLPIKNPLHDFGAYLDSLCLIRHWKSIGSIVCKAELSTHHFCQKYGNLENHQPRKKAISAFGSISVLINNGGISQRSLALETNMEVERKIMEVNYFDTKGLSKSLLPHFIEQKGGHFAVASSLVGKFGSPYRSSYAASKPALHGFFDSLKAEHHKDNNHVTMICPGFVTTNVSINALTGGGSPLNQMDKAQETGMSPEKCASKYCRRYWRKNKRNILVEKKPWPYTSNAFSQNYFLNSSEK